MNNQSKNRYYDLALAFALSTKRHQDRKMVEKAVPALEKILLSKGIYVKHNPAKIQSMVAMRDFNKASYAYLSIFSDKGRVRECNNRLVGEKDFSLFERIREFANDKDIAVLFTEPTNHKTMYVSIPTRTHSLVTDGVCEGVYPHPVISVERLKSRGDFDLDEFLIDYSFNTVLDQMEDLTTDEDDSKLPTPGSKKDRKLNQAELREKQRREARSHVKRHPFFKTK